MLVEFKNKLKELPFNITYIQTLEEFEGDILNKYQSDDNKIFLEKWCALDEKINRYLIVESKEEDIFLYLENKISMLTLINNLGDNGFIIDRFKGEIIAVYQVTFSELPGKYLPKSTAYHI